MLQESLDVFKHKAYNASFFSVNRPRWMSCSAIRSCVRSATKLHTQCCTLCRNR
jgi:hypothetical protein